MAEFRRDLVQVVVVLHLAQYVGNTGHTCFLSDAVRVHLVVHEGAHLGTREHHLQAELLRELFGLLIEHEEEHFACLPLHFPAFDVVAHLAVCEQIVVDVLDTLELLVRLFLHRTHQVGMQPIEALDVGDELEALDPFVGTQQVEVGGTDEVDGCFVAIEEATDIADAFDGGSRGFELPFRGLSWCRFLQRGSHLFLDNGLLTHVFLVFLLALPLPLVSGMAGKRIPPMAVPVRCRPSVASVNRTRPSSSR